jgi:predicted aspartyl protease
VWFCPGSRRVVGRASTSRVQSVWSAARGALAVSGSAELRILAERRATGLSAVVAAVLLAWTPVLSLETGEEVPFELYQRHLIVTKGSIGPLNGLSLLIDTGTIPSMVDARIARKLHVQTEPSMLVAFGRSVAIQSTTLNGFRIGERRSGSVPAGVSDLSYLEGVRIDAIVGLDVLAGTSFSIDYRKHVLRFSSVGRGQPVAPLEFVWPFLTVRLTIAGQQVRLLVDTGSSDVVLFTSRMPRALSRAPWKGEKIVQYASGSARLKRLELRQVRLGARVWDKLSAWALDRLPDGYPASIDGVLGVAALGCQRVQFDFERNELGCSP